MAAWDDEEFDVNKAGVTDKWDGEDEDDDDLMDNWDDEGDEDATKNKDNVPASQPKKKMTRLERIAEKEAKKKEEFEAKKREMQAEEDRIKELSPEEQLEEKLKNQRLQEESDLELAKEAFGVTEVIKEVIPGQKTIDNFNPTDREEFIELSNMISKKLITYEHKIEYSTFLENMFRDCCAGVDPEDIKRISNSLNILATEKLKLTKAATKGGKKKAAAKKNTLSTGKGVKNDMAYDDDYYNEYEDFM